MQSKDLTAVDLFCGAGGLTVGLSMAGFKVLAGVEYNSVAAESYRMNHPDIALYEKDIVKLDPLVAPGVR
ncbi:DNA cytosine methyltransferase, partial [Pseudomonas syringae]